MRKIKNKPRSEYLNINKVLLNKFNIHNYIYGIDSKFFIDPILLDKTELKDFINSRNFIDEYFKDIFILLSQSEYNSDRFWEKSLEMMIAKENNQTSLGYANSLKENGGSGIGPELASRLLLSAKTIISSGYDNPRILELLGLFEKGFGADRISDLITKIIIKDIYKFNQRIANECKIKKELTIIEKLENGEEFLLPKDPFKNKPCLLLPKSILTKLPIALDFSHISFVISKNESLRRHVNSKIGKNWKEILKDQKGKRGFIKNMILKDSENLSNLEKSYEGATNKRTGYNFKEDICGEEVYYNEAVRETSINPIIEDLKNLKIFEVVEIILKKFKKSIEFDGGNILLYTNNNKVRHESYSQVLLFMNTRIYSDICNIDVNREVKIGRGIMDVKFSKGNKEKVIVETKLSKNDVIKGYKKQLPLYMESENTQYGYYIIIKISAKDEKTELRQDKKIRQLLEVNDKNMKEGKKCPKIVVIDGRIKPTASKL